MTSTPRTNHRDDLGELDVTFGAPEQDVGGTDALVTVLAVGLTGLALYAASGLARYGNDSGAETVFVLFMLALAASGATAAVWAGRRTLHEARPRPDGVPGPRWWSYAGLALAPVAWLATISGPSGAWHQVWLLVGIMAVQPVIADSRWIRQRKAVARRKHAQQPLPGEDETDRLLRLFPIAHVTALADDPQVHVGLDWDGDTPGERGYVTHDFDDMRAALTFACLEAHVITVRFDGGEPHALVRDAVSRACWERIHQREAALHGVQPAPRWITPAEALAHR